MAIPDMSSKPASSSMFVFGGKSETTRMGTRTGATMPTKPLPFTFSTNLPSKTEGAVNGNGKSALSVPTQARRSMTPAARVTPRRAPPSEKKQPEEVPLYDLEAVRAARVELKHLKGVEADSSKDHEMRTASLITREAYIAGGFEKRSMQYGVIGETLAIHSKSSAHVPIDPRLYVNTNAPFSAVVCGVQGSGKSHTVSVLLENMFISSLDSIGSLSKPLAGLVLHFGEGGPSTRPSEAAWVGVPSVSHPTVKTPPVRVFVSRSSLNTMRTVYAPLGKHVQVMPLVFNESELDAQAFLSMMAVGSSESAPLYIQVVLSILRELGESFSYQRFMQRLDAKNFNPAQTAGLEQRLSLLQSFMEPQSSHQHASSRKHAHADRGARFAAGQLTIVDLSDPFIDPASACGLFEIVTRLFVRAEVGTGKVLVVDEAHKYLSTNRGVAGLTKALLTLTREQRHLAMRTIISTQEPTVVPPILLDLCTVAIMHRFSSPAWWEHLAKHVSADVTSDEGFDRVVKLQTGEAIVLAPSGLGVFPEDDDDETPHTPMPTPIPAPLKLSQFGRRLVLMKTRARVTMDGGASVLVVESDEEDDKEDDDDDDEDEEDDDEDDDDDDEE